MMYFSVSRAWLFSRTSQLVYLLCSILDLAFLGTQLVITMVMSFAEVYSLPSMIRIIVGCALVPEVIGTAVLAVGMTYCWLAVGGSCGRKLVWFWCISLFVITMPIYYFCRLPEACGKTRERTLRTRSGDELSMFNPL